MPFRIKLQCKGFQGPCTRVDATLHRQNTAYVEDSMNWVTLCPDCAKENHAFWEEQWREYWSDKL